MNLGQNCDICWDEGQKEVPAFTIVSGVPLCNLHVREFQSRKQERVVKEKVEPDVTTPFAADLARKRVRKSAAVAAKGVKSAKDFAELMTALMDDLLSNAVDMGTAMAVCNAGDRLLRVAEMQIRYQPRGGGALLLGQPQSNTRNPNMPYSLSSNNDESTV